MDNGVPIDVCGIMPRLTPCGFSTMMGLGMENRAPALSPSPSAANAITEQSAAWVYWPPHSLLMAEPQAAGVHFQSLQTEEFFADGLVVPRGGGGRAPEGAEKMKVQTDFSARGPRRSCRERCRNASTSRSFMIVGATG